MVALAQMVDITPQAISTYERGESTPRPEVLAKISTVLNVPRSRFFARPMEEDSEGAVFYRSLAAATKTQRRAAERRFSWLKEIVSELADEVLLPPVRCPNEYSSRKEALSSEEIEQTALNIRRAWNIGDGPISNIVWLLENNGIIVARLALGAAELDAFSQWALCRGERRPYMILNAEKASCARSRFDASHELGHLVLHSEHRNALTRGTDFNRLEDQAHRFAGAFLLPAASFAAEYAGPTLDSLLALKERWRVSVGMMIRRARDLEFIGSEAERRLWINYSRRGWRTREPLDDVLLPETPRLLPRVLEALAEAGCSGPVLRDRFALSPTDIAALTGAPASHFDDPTALAPVIHLRPRPQLVVEDVHPLLKSSS
jgi:Zn-dependent peptidase ImmA (M78 family)